MRSPKVPLALSLLGHAVVTFVRVFEGVGSVYGWNKWGYPLSVPGFSSRLSLMREGPSLIAKSEAPSRALPSWTRWSYFSVGV